MKIAHDLPEAAITALGRNRLIEAIKITRAATGLGLKESKDAVESYLLMNPALKEQIDATRVSINFTREHVVIFVIALVMLSAYLLFAR